MEIYVIINITLEYSSSCRIRLTQFQSQNVLLHFINKINIIYIIIQLSARILMIPHESCFFLFHFQDIVIIHLTTTVMKLMPMTTKKKCKKNKIK